MRLNSDQIETFASEILKLDLNINSNKSQTIIYQEQIITCIISENSIKKSEI